MKIWIPENLEPRQVQAHEAHQVSSFSGFRPLPGRCVLAGILTRHDAPRDRNASPPAALRGFQFRLLPQGMSEFAPEVAVPWTASYDRVAATVAVHAQQYVLTLSARSRRSASMLPCLPQGRLVGQRGNLIDL